MTQSASAEQEALVLLSWYEEGDGFAQGTKAPYNWVLRAESELRRLNSYVIELESEAQANARIIGASAENELALRARVQELQRRVAKLENELSARGTCRLKPVAWMHEDTFYNMQNTARSEKTRWLVYNLSEHHSTSGMIPLYVAPVQDKQGCA